MKLELERMKRSSHRDAIRIVSLAPNVTSILLALGAGRELVAVSRWCKDVAAVGTWYFQSCEFPEMVSLVCQGLKPEVLISHRFEASEAPTAFRMMSEGKTAKAVLRWPDE